MHASRLLSVALALIVAACAEEEGSVRTETVELIVDESVLRGDDAFAVIEPVYWSAEIYGSHEEYESSLHTFSHAQRLLFAVHWYLGEVSNGGHDQFYFNSTGIVWRDALEGLHAIGSHDGAEILEQSAARLGGEPSLDHDRRQQQLEGHQPSFDDLDDAFYALEEREDLNAKMLAYARQHPAAFYFRGKITRSVLPGS